MNIAFTTYLRQRVIITTLTRSITSLCDTDFGIVFRIIMKSIKHLSDTVNRISQVLYSEPCPASIQAISNMSKQNRVANVRD